MKIAPIRLCVKRHEGRPVFSLVDGEMHEFAVECRAKNIGSFHFGRSKGELLPHYVIVRRGGEEYHVYLNPQPDVFGELLVPYAGKGLSPDMARAMTAISGIDEAKLLKVADNFTDIPAAFGVLRSKAEIYAEAFWQRDEFTIHTLS